MCNYYLIVKRIFNGFNGVVIVPFGIVIHSGVIKQKILIVIICRIDQLKSSAIGIVDISIRKSIIVGFVDKVTGGCIFKNGAPLPFALIGIIDLDVCWRSVGSTDKH